jgi:hypothetical protein
MQQDATMYQNVIIPLLYKAQQVQCAWQRPPTPHPTTFHVWKTRDCQCSFRLLMMGGVSPETCWASYNYEIIKFWYTVASCWIFLYEYMNELFISLSVLMIPIDTWDEGPKTEIWAWAKCCLRYSFIFTYWGSLNTQNNVVWNYVSNWKDFLPAV